MTDLEHSTTPTILEWFLARHREQFLSTLRAEFPSRLREHCEKHARRSLEEKRKIAELNTEKGIVPFAETVKARFGDIAPAVTAFLSEDEALAAIVKERFEEPAHALVVMAPELNGFRQESEEVAASVKEWFGPDADERRAVTKPELRHFEAWRKRMPSVVDVVEYELFVRGEHNADFSNAVEQAIRVHAQNLERALRGEDAKILEKTERQARWALAVYEVMKKLHEPRLDLDQVRQAEDPLFEVSAHRLCEVFKEIAKDAVQVESKAPKALNAEEVRGQLWTFYSKVCVNGRGILTLEIPKSRGLVEDDDVATVSHAALIALARRSLRAPARAPSRHAQRAKGSEFWGETAKPPRIAPWGLLFTDPRRRLATREKWLR